MTAARRRRWGVNLLLVAMLAGPAWGEDDPLSFEERVVAVVRQSGQPSTIMVIRLYHAEAEVLAATLNQVLPPGTTVVPDPPTNSLIVSTWGNSPTARGSAPTRE